MSEQFENSIRKKLQDAEIPFDPAAWDQMKKRLDDSGRRRPPFWWWIGALLILLGVGGWWLFSSEDRIPVSGSIKADVNVDKTIEQRVSPDSGTNSHEGVNKPVTIAPAEDSKKGKGKFEKPGVAVNNTSGKNENYTAPALHKSQKVPGGNMLTVGNIAANGKQIKETDIAGNNVNKQVDNTSSQTSPQMPVAKNENVDKPATKPAATPSVINTDADKPVAASGTDSVKTPVAADETGIKKRGKRKFDAGIMLGPDYNTVSSLKYGRIGFGGGLLLRYHINSNFTVSTGAAYAKKLYGADDKDYYSNYPTNYKKIDADCNVLDVPVNIHYTFLRRPTHSWSVMAGASSYFMLREEYEYYNYNGGKYTREYNNKNQHYFSVLNLAFGYERETKGIIKWGVQPYVKLPLGGVGAGKVNLYSAGILLQVTVGKKD